LFPPLCFLLPIIVGRFLPRGDFVEGAPFRLHPHVGVARQHGSGDVPGDAHDPFVFAWPYNAKFAEETKVGSPREFVKMVKC
jgi:hypothetical protein